MKTQTQSQRRADTRGDENRDPITGAPGAHPVGTGLGAAGGAVAGAALGAVGGPVTAAVGLVGGAIVGGLTGKSLAESVDPTVEDAYWRENYANQPYIDRKAPYDLYAPAYRTGYEGRVRYQGSSFEDSEEQLARDYESNRGDSQLSREQARRATRDAWHRVERAVPGDADGDGR